MGAKESAFAARDALRGHDARTPAREILGMTQEEFSRAFESAPMKRAKLRGRLKRDAAVVLGNVGDERDGGVLTRARRPGATRARARAAWALERSRVHARRSTAKDGGQPGPTAA